MGATIKRLRTRADRLRADEAAELRRLIAERLDLPDRARLEIIAAIDRETAAEEGWTFVMLSPAQNDAVLTWLGLNSSRPIRAMMLWGRLFTRLDRQTGEINFTRDELAEEIGEYPSNVSAIMSELEACGAIIRRRVRVAGMRGPGTVRYFMNPKVATHLKGAARDKAQAEAPELRLVEREPAE